MYAHYVSRKEFCTMQAYEKHQEWALYIEYYTDQFDIV